MVLEKDTILFEEIVEQFSKIFKVEHPKQHLFGMETEYMFLDSKGYVSSVKDNFFKSTDIIKKECGRNMVEIATLPYRNINNTIENTLSRAEKLKEMAEKRNKTLFFFGCYPGKFDPPMRTKGVYGIKYKIFGKEKFNIAGRCIGLHCHYTIPKNMFDVLSRRFNIFLRSGVSSNLVGSYNILIALDPALTTLTQSSPYYQGVYYGKDSRVMFYRGSKIFGVSGFYTDYEYFGGLPHYKHTVTDILHVMDDRFKEWSIVLRKVGINLRSLTMYGSVLDTNWSPVKINPLGTLEIRGMDMNRFQIIAPVSILPKFILRFIYKNSINVVESEEGIKKPFKLEGRTLFIPPYDYLNEELQRDSAIRGLESKKVRLYCNNLMRLSQKILPKENKKLIKPLKKIMRRGKTTSDDIISKVRKMGYDEVIPRKDAAEIALKLSESFEKDIEITRKLISY